MKTRITRIRTNLETCPSQLFAAIFSPSFPIRANSCYSCLFSAFLRVSLRLCGCIFVLHTSFAASTNDLTSALQKGLFEEEANRNFPAAIEAYQGVINHFDEDRKLAATALFRLGEIYRKQGKTNEANAQYERVVREFSDQSQLATLSQSYLGPALAINAPTTNANSESAPTADEAEEVRKIRAMIRDSPDLVNATDQGGLTRLHTAASQGHLIVAQFLIENKADVNAKTRFGGNTPLYIAAREGHKAFVELLLSHGGSVQIADSIGGTPLHAAAQKGFRNIVEVLLAHGANVNAKTQSGSTPLHLAVANGSKSVAELLLAHGADVNTQTSDARDQAQAHAFNGTPLHIAVERDEQPLAELLLAHKADPNATNTAGNRPLHIAAQDGNQKLIELLLSSKAVVDPINTNGETPLDLSATCDRTSATSLLLARGADVNAANPVSKGPIGWTPLVYALVRGKKETAALLLNSNANPNVKTANSIGSKWWPSGVTPLLAACGKPDPEAVALLLDSKADPNLKSDSGFTPTVVALKAPDLSDCKRMLSLLLDHGADTEARDDSGRTLLMIAVERRDNELVKLLLSHQANPNAKNPSGFTPLHFVALAFDGTYHTGYPMDSLPAITGALLAAGAHVNLQDKGGRTAFNRLINPGTSSILTGPPRDEVIKLLQAHGAISDLPRLDAIEVRRSEANYSKVIFTEGTNGWDHFTLFEVLAVEYKILAAPPGGESRTQIRGLPGAVADRGLAFPDFKRVRIRHPAPDFKSFSERVIDVDASLTAGDCSADVSLEMGDQVEIPEADHVLGANWQGLSSEIFAALEKCLTGSVSIRIKGRTETITRKPGGTQVSLPGGSSTVSLRSFMIKPLLVDSKLLLSSSDLSRIRLIRKDAATGQKKELTVDCSEDKPAPSVWLRDGDIIEVPDKP